MLKFRASAGGRVRGIAVLLLVTACTPAMREYGQRPQPLARDWLDTKKTLPMDTSVWRLSTNGTDLTVHVLVQPNGAGGKPQEVVSRHGIWYVRGTLADTQRAICFNRRPGRAASSCIPFVVDTLRDGRLRLVLREYVGTHETAPRTLIERRP